MLVSSACRRLAASAYPPRGAQTPLARLRKVRSPYGVFRSPRSPACAKWKADVRLRQTRRSSRDTKLHACRPETAAEAERATLSAWLARDWRLLCPENVNREEIAQSCLDQAGWAAKLGSPMYEGLLRRIAEDVRAGGPCLAALADARAAAASRCHSPHGSRGTVALSRAVLPLGGRASR